MENLNILNKDKDEKTQNTSTMTAAIVVYVAPKGFDSMQLRRHNAKQMLRKR